LIAAWHKARTKASADAELQWATRQLAADMSRDGLSAAQRHALLAPYLRLAELEPYSAYRALRDRWSVVPSDPDEANEANEANEPNEPNEPNEANEPDEPDEPDEPNQANEPNSVPSSAVE
jgi:hypothetical protein